MQEEHTAGILSLPFEGTHRGPPASLQMSLAALQRDIAAVEQVMDLSTGRSAGSSTGLLLRNLIQVTRIWMYNKWYGFWIMAT